MVTRMAFIPNIQLRAMCGLQWPEVKEKLVNATGSKNAELRPTQIKGMEIIKPLSIVLTDPQVDAEYVAFQFADPDEDTPVWFI